MLLERLGRLAEVSTIEVYFANDQEVSGLIQSDYPVSFGIYHYPETEGDKFNGFAREVSSVSTPNEFFRFYDELAFHRIIRRFKPGVSGVFGDRLKLKELIDALFDEAEDFLIPRDANSYTLLDYHKEPVAVVVAKGDNISIHGNTGRFQVVTKESLVYIIRDILNPDYHDRLHKVEKMVEAIEANYGTFICHNNGSFIIYNVFGNEVGTFEYGEEFKISGKVVNFQDVLKTLKELIF